MSDDYKGAGNGPQGWGPQQGYGPGYGPGYNQGYGPGYGPGHGPQPGWGPAPQQQRRIDLLDVIEGVMTDGLSFSNLGRIARASGSKFWLGAAIGAGAVVLARKPELRGAVSHIFHKPGQEG